MKPPVKPELKTGAQQAPFSVIRNFLLAQLIDNFDLIELEHLETRLLTALGQNRRLQGVIFDFSAVVTTDLEDLRRLQQVFQAISLLGARIGLCGISPGLAAVIVRSDLAFHRQMIGADIDDLFMNRL